jgi:hypothetical protein
MNKRSLSCLVGLLASLNAFAGTCNNGSLINVYSYEFDSYATSLQAWNAAVGRMTFKGDGSGMAGGVETLNGAANSVTGTVTYSVSSSCNVTGSVLWSTGFTSHFRFYLDEIDTAPETNIAYHATAAVWTPGTGVSSRGSLTRRYGKFN